MITTQNIDQIFYLTKKEFERKAINFFEYQKHHCQFYERYLIAISRESTEVNSTLQIPFLPIRFFKNQQIITLPVEKIDPKAETLLFESSGTTGDSTSKHYVADRFLYEQSFANAFESTYGNIGDYCFLALLPSYLERGNSSLVHMVDYFIKRSGHPLSHFYLHNQEELSVHLKELERIGQKTILWGVTYALLDFAERYPMKLQNTLVMETGGMKGRRSEMIREEVHMNLSEAFQIQKIHAEYGMTELLSQAYSKGDGIFHCPPWMRVLVRDINDPFQVSSEGKGLLNIIDLANIHSCCFIATDDIGEVFADGSFMVNGRLDNSDLRGCSLMYES